METGGLRVALIHDLLASYGGSEQVLLQLHRLFPQAPIYTSVHDPCRLPAEFAELQVRTTFLQRLPWSRSHYETVVPLMPFAFARLDLSGYDLVISSSHACSKGVTTDPRSLHVCYCHTPMRYAWSHQEIYLAKAPLRPLTAPPARALLAWLRRWDAATARRPHHLLCNSEHVRRRIQRFWGRDAEVVYPPVRLERFSPPRRPPLPDAPFLVVGRLVEYKRTEVAVQACSRLGLPLQVIGRGPELGRLQRLAGPSVRFLGEVSDAELACAYRNCRALIFPPDEDFGLVPLEAMASGRPVLALGAGGALETVVPGVTGDFYPDAGLGEEGVEALVRALQSFRPSEYDPADCRARAEQFSPARFRQQVAAALERQLASRRSVLTPAGGGV